MAVRSAAVYVTVGAVLACHVAIAAATIEIAVGAVPAALNVTTPSGTL
jgi:hypothetical protein